MNEQQKKAVSTVIGMLLAKVMGVPYVRIAQLAALIVGVMEIKDLEIKVERGSEAYPELPKLPEDERKTLFPLHRK